MTNTIDNQQGTIISPVIVEENKHLFTNNGYLKFVPVDYIGLCGVSVALHGKEVSLDGMTFRTNAEVSEISGDRFKETKYVLCTQENSSKLMLSTATDIDLKIQDGLICKFELKFISTFDIITGSLSSMYSFGKYSVINNGVVIKSEDDSVDPANAYIRLAEDALKAQGDFGYKLKVQ